jgi:hypothetical protein
MSYHPDTLAGSRARDANIGIRSLAYDAQTGKLNEVNFKPALERK